MYHDGIWERGDTMWYPYCSREMAWYPYCLRCHWRVKKDIFTIAICVYHDMWYSYCSRVTAWYPYCARALPWASKKDIFTIANKQKWYKRCGESINYIVIEQYMCDP